MGNERYYEAFVIFNFDPIKMHLQGRTVDGKTREFALAITRDLRTNELSLDVVPHFSDPVSQPTFSGSEPWEGDEKRV